jgi:glycosyltransferase involved in cell wall biosynthesis
MLQHAISRASLVVATSEVECEDVRRAEYRGPIAVIPHGIDGPVAPRATTVRQERELLYLGRIHPIKGVRELLRAWALVAPRFPAWRLRLVGPGRDAHVQQARGLADALALPRVCFDGPRYGEAKSSAFFAADLAVAPSLAESFGVAIGEALAHGVPVVVSRAAPWAGVAAHACGWTTDVSVPALVSTLNAALSTPRAALRAMGERGRAWVSTEFTWPAAAARMVDAYQWVLGRGPRPSFILVTSD